MADAVNRTEDRSRGWVQVCEVLAGRRQSPVCESAEILKAESWNHFLSRTGKGRGGVEANASGEAEVQRVANALARGRAGASPRKNGRRCRVASPAGPRGELWPPGARVAGATKVAFIPFSPNPADRLLFPFTPLTVDWPNEKTSLFLACAARLLDPSDRMLL